MELTPVKSSCWLVDSNAIYTSILATPSQKYFTSRRWLCGSLLMPWIINSLYQIINLALSGTTNSAMVCGPYKSYLDFLGISIRYSVMLLRVNPMRGLFLTQYRHDFNSNMHIVSISIILGLYFHWFSLATSL